MIRKHHFPKQPELTHQTVIANPPRTLYHQQTDWTCSVACIRSILSGIEAQVPDEQAIIDRYGLVPGPHYSKDIKRLKLLDSYDTVYGCDQEEIEFDRILDYMENGYYVMLESMYNYAHWYVLLGYYPLAEGNIETGKLLVYDPYYNETRLLNTDEFIAMWVDGNYEHSRVQKDFIALKKK